MFMVEILKSVWKFAFKHKRRLLLSLFSIICAGIGSFFFLLAAAAVGSGLSNAADISSTSYFWGEKFAIVAVLTSGALPFITAAGLFLYWTGRARKIAHFCMFSGGCLIVFYFTLAHIGALIYLAIKYSPTFFVKICLTEP